MESVVSNAFGHNTSDWPRKEFGGNFLMATSAEAEKSATYGLVIGSIGDFEQF